MTASISSLQASSCKRFVLFILTAFIGLSSLWAQTGLGIRGRVLDHEHKALPIAAVILRPSSSPDSEVGQKGTTTDRHGVFTLSDLKAGSYVMQVSFIGYTTHKQTITLKAGEGVRSLGDITLSEDDKLLADLVVEGKATEVVLRGDTIEYNAGSFKTTEGSALEELIKKLPGAEVSADGKITINGKEISQIMVDGKRFFDSDPKVAVKSLPADLIDKVQVLDRETDAARMSGFADGDDETIINLTVKPGRKQGLFGTVYAGGGTKQRYEANGMINRFTDGNQWTILGGANNTNNSGFSDIATDLSQSDLARAASGSNRRPWERNNTNDGITSSQMIGGNTALTISAQAEIGGNAFAGRSDKEMNVRSHITNIQTSGNTIDEGEMTERNLKNNFGANLRLTWKPDDHSEIIVTPNFNFGTGVGSYHSVGTTSLASSSAIISTSDLKQSTESRSFAGGLNLDASRKLGDSGRTLSLALNARLSGDDAMGKYHSDIYTSASGIHNLVNQRLENEGVGRNLRVRLSYVEPLGKSYALQFTYQLRGVFSRSGRSAFDADALGAYTIANDSYSYDFTSSFWAHRAGLAIKRKGANYDITAGFNVDPSVLDSRTISAGTVRHVVHRSLNYSPTLRFSYKQGRAMSLRFDYRGMNSQPTANQLAPIQDVTNPLLVVEGNANLRPAFRHNFMGNFNLFSSKTQSSLTIFGYGRIVQDEIVSTSRYDVITGVRTNGYTNVNGNWLISLGGFYTTPLPWRRFSLRLNSRNSIVHQVGFVDGQRNNASTLSFNEGLSLGYRDNWLDTNIQGRWTHGRTTNSLQTLKGQITNDYQLGWDATITLPLSLTLESQLSHTITRGYASGYDREQTLWNLSLGYSFMKGKAATLRLKVYDVLGQQRNVYQSITALAISSQETNTIGQYAMLHFIYRFNSFSANSSRNDMRSTSMGGPGRF